MRIPKRRVKIARLLLRVVGRFLEILLTRTTITGLENVPTHERPLIFAGNHASTYDPVLLLIHIPVDVRLVGPGDFKLLPPGDLLVKALGVILIHRGTADRDSLKKMTSLLNDNENLILFPDGGTWEKRLDDVKPGVAYLSLTTGAKIIPLAVGGTYQVWSKIFRLKRPRISLHFEPPMPPIISESRKNRQEDLRQASLALMNVIYNHLPMQEQARFDLHSRQKFSGQLDIVPDVLNYKPSLDFGVLAELISKPNLFSPLYRNLRLPLEPFLHHKRFHAAMEFQTAAVALLQTFTGELKDYLSYRLGDQKAKQALIELQELETISQQALEQDLVMRFIPNVTVLDTPLPPNT